MPVRRAPNTSSIDTIPSKWKFALVDPIEVTEIRFVPTPTWSATMPPSLYPTRCTGPPTTCSSTSMVSTAISG